MTSKQPVCVCLCEPTWGRRSVHAANPCGQTLPAHLHGATDFCDDRLHHLRRVTPHTKVLFACWGLHLDIQAVIGPRILRAKLAWEPLDDVLVWQLLDLLQAAQQQSAFTDPW